MLSETGCYADLTFPSAPSPTQPRMVNAIYRAWDRPEGRGHDSGERVFNIQHPTRNTQYPRMDGSGLLMVQGPLGLNFGRRKWGVFPRIENAEISGANRPTPDRVRLWARTGIHVTGRPEWVFVKLHAHGCMPANGDVLLGEAMKEMHTFLQRRFNDGKAWQLHYVSAREMVNIVLAAEDGLVGNPGQFRDHAIAPPAAS